MYTCKDYMSMLYSDISLAVCKAKVSNNLFIVKMAPYVYVRLYRAFH